MFIFLIVILILGFILYIKKDEIMEKISKLKYKNEDENESKLFFNRKLNDEFVNNEFIDNTISKINNEGIDYLEIYKDRMEFKDRVVNYSNIGMDELENAGECRALACFIQSNLNNKYKYEVSKISNLYDNNYTQDTVGYSITDRTKKIEL